MSKKKKEKASQKKGGGTGKSGVVKTISIVALVLAVSVAAGFFLTGGGDNSPSALGGEKRETMSPKYFLGKTAKAYWVAQEIPQILDKVYCYCKCQDDHGHKSLLTCFVDRHGSQCGICMDEALMAYDLAKKGYKTEDIVDKINSRFSKPLR